jgi:choline/glycine/proline betaine transport protein
MLIVDGVPALQNATIVMGLPFAFVMVLVMAGLYRALQAEAGRATSRAGSLPGSRFGRTPGSARHSGPSPRLWRGRGTGPGEGARFEQFLAEVAQPALDEVARELRASGVEVETRGATDDGTADVELVADPGGAHPFHYGIAPVAVPLGHSRSAPHADASRHRLEVHLRESAQGYDVMDYTYAELVDDVLDQYRHHRADLRLDEVGTGPARRDARGVTGRSTFTAVKPWRARRDRGGSSPSGRR